MTPLRRLVPAAAAIAVLAAAAVVVVGTITTSSARVAARTDVASFIAAGSVELERPDSSIDLLFDATGLYPGVDVEGCVDVDYRGSIPADIRLHAGRLGGDGLEQFMDVRVDVLPGGCDDSPGATNKLVFSGTLDALFVTHGSYEAGVGLSDGVVAGDRLGIRVAASLTGGNQAQGLTVDFLVTVEARP